MINGHLSMAINPASVKILVFDPLRNARPSRHDLVANFNITGLWQMFRTFVLRCDWSILRILKSTKKHERQSECVTLGSIYNNIFRLYHN